MRASLRYFVAPLRKVRMTTLNRSVSTNFPLSLMDRIKGKTEIDTEKELFRTKRAMGAYFSKGYYTDALNCAIELESVIEQLMGSNSAMYASALNNVALMNKMLGNLPIATEKYTRALMIYDKVSGKRHPSYASTLSNLGILYREQAMATANTLDKEQLLARAEEALGDSLQLKLTLHGASHRDTIVTANNLAALLRLTGRVADAESRLQESLTLCLATHGDLDSLTAQTLNALGLLCKQEKRYLEAKAHYQQALSIRSATLGDAHPDTITSMHNLAELMLEMGDTVGATSLQTQIVQIVEKIPSRSATSNIQSPGKSEPPVSGDVAKTTAECKDDPPKDKPPPFTYATRRKKTQ